MQLTEQISESFGTLKLNKMRTGLAILGIVIGIGSVIALVSLGQSSQQSITSQIQSLGSNLLTISPVRGNSGMVRTAGAGTTLTNADATAIKTSTKITTVKTVSPEYTGRLQVVTGKNNTNTSIIGATSAYMVVHNVSLSSGSFISDKDVTSTARVAVLGPTTATDLFGEYVNPIGQSIRIGSQNITIIGITDSKGGTGMGSQDDRIYVPLTTAQKLLFGAKYLSSIAIEAKSAEVMDEARIEIGYLLLDQHNLTDPTKADFTIMSQDDILSTASSVTGTFTSLLTGIAAISLLVGGIGIMNIMLVTVTERTREIGLRKALGAKKKTIITQFLTESVILTFIGGILGIILGIFASFIYSKINSSTFYISPVSIILAFVVSAAIGIIFGWYPARRAANLQPIEALRYE
ncbi:MAG: ABC transporter, permease protein [Candidatus Collierbacteria bacterium GW2011_GWB1_44_35]|uniref:ABC transporter, permease protein n=6 Tax=Candidatus Collieribacteriota TaxID=1752725 RepID=A0A0G1KG03_9BACT|nr:MAG: ABC transporter, permease protein [Candidatus Collierbacteria bacterium GW2011_GWA1_44_12]KKT37528.1 MAG: ABC transporter, permease protein [Candidatus Collierbacteria bacterium GW2011_GWF1_44_12]KKT46789.1 MAG: ABC transporter, permease protein [Candidatus Collierbacteria bacterium GW2011_GWF2_44_15]KKT67860.1 MAG: ABC transporter, permease protein [Candidatus Collierbacteria bacterium GW2011_GWB1_44_35]KKT97361.1 MAG: ABC transporter, permease protein [Candidatus Collierbacteria bacte